MKHLFLIFLLFFCSATLSAQLPNTDIYLLELNWSKKGDLSVKTPPENLTQRSGYDNQPSFLPDGETLLFTAADTSGQTDIYRLNLTTKALQNLTQTPETSEYSAVSLPGNDFFTVVRVESDGKTQRLWQFPLSDTITKETPVLYQPHIANVGYYCRTPQNNLALFIITEPPTLQITLPADSSGMMAAANIGRCIQDLPNQPDALSFLFKLSNDTWLIKRLTLSNLDTQTIATALIGSEDFVFLPDGSIIMGKNSRLFRWQAKTQVWSLLADFSDLGLRNVTRLAINAKGTKLAIVAETYR